MHRRHRHREPARPPRPPFSPLFARLALGGTIAIAVLSAGVYVFIPIYDLSPPQRGAAEQALATPASAPPQPLLTGGS